MRACPHCTEKCVRQLAHICSRGRGSVRAATAGTVAPSHPLLKFGKLTTKFEMLYQFRKSESYRPSVPAYGKAVPSRLSHLRSVSLRQSLKCYAKKLKVSSFKTSSGQTSGSFARCAGGVRRRCGDGRLECERGMNNGRVGQRVSIAVGARRTKSVQSTARLSKAIIAMCAAEKHSKQQKRRSPAGLRLFSVLSKA